MFPLLPIYNFLSPTQLFCCRHCWKSTYVSTDGRWISMLYPLIISVQVRVFCLWPTITAGFCTVLCCLICQNNVVHLTQGRCECFVYRIAHQCTQFRPCCYTNSKYRSAVRLMMSMCIKISKLNGFLLSRFLS